MPDVDGNQPLGTPTWVDLAVPDLQPALDFYGAVFGGEFGRMATVVDPFGAEFSVIARPPSRPRPRRPTW